MKKIILTIVIAYLSVVVLPAQSLLPPATMFSREKPSMITLNNGEEIEGNIKKIKRKKGLIEEITIEGESGETVELSSTDIAFMYLPPSGLDKFANTMDYVHDATRWKNTDLKHDVIEKGYVYFETANVEIKKSTEPMLMQLLNPAYSSKIKIFHDPFAQETASLGVSGINVAGGTAKSYYVKKSDGTTAKKMQKKNYEEEFDSLYDGCSSVTSKYEDINWSEFPKHVYVFDTECD